MATDWRNTRAYRIWRALVIRRDKVCQVCGSREGRHAHHINSGQYFPLERYDVENGICLCTTCHIMYHTDFNRSYRVKTDRYNFENFMEVVKYLKEIGLMEAIRHLEEIRKLSIVKESG